MWNWWPLRKQYGAVCVLDFRYWLYPTNYNTILLNSSHRFLNYINYDGWFVLLAHNTACRGSAVAARKGDRLDIASYDFYKKINIILGINLM